jgi:hypothetical protein
MDCEQKSRLHLTNALRFACAATVAALCYAALPKAVVAQGQQTMRTGDNLQENTVHKIDLHAHGWRGTVLDNVGNADREGSGFNPLCNGAFPDDNLFRNDGVGWNFEHIFNGAATDASRSMFTPRNDPCFLRKHTDASASLHWSAHGSSWGVESEMTYTIVDRHTVDLQFKATLTEDVWPMGYLAMMWASYMNHTRDRRIHFYGKEGDREGWVSFGDDVDDGFETGTVRYHDVNPLAYEDGAQTLNIIEHPLKTYILPFYYGLVDGDGDNATKEDTMAYIVMFDQAHTIRFAMWNFIRNPEGNPDTHSPAWDWQFVIRSPERGKTYSYRSRILYKPFESPHAVLKEYETWRRQLDNGQPTPQKPSQKQRE